MKSKISGEYASKGDYHKKLREDWPYLPIYLEKMKRISEILFKFRNLKILDAGCGEGVLVDKYKSLGYDIQGIDLNYSSKDIRKGSILKMPFKDSQFDVVLCLDVLEHIDISNQHTAIRELVRVTKKGGLIIFGLPNLAHFASRLSFLITGKLLRTSEVERHFGDRPILEFINLIKKQGGLIEKRIGLFPTFPIISFMTVLFPKHSLLLHKIYNQFFSYPNWCFENIIIVRKK